MEKLPVLPLEFSDTDYQHSLGLNIDTDGNPRRPQADILYHLHVHVLEWYDAKELHLKPVSIDLVRFYRNRITEINRNAFILQTVSGLPARFHRIPVKQS